MRVPENAVLLDPAGRLFHGFRSQGATVHPPVYIAAQETSGFEHAQVLGDGGERDAERFCKLGDSRFAESEAGEDGAAGGIGESGKGGVEVGRIVNHMV